MVTAMREEVIKSIEAQIPLQRLAAPTEIAAAVMYLVSDHAAYVTAKPYQSTAAYTCTKRVTPHFNLQVYLLE